MSRKIYAAFAVAMAAAALTGCAGLDGYSVRTESAAQSDVIGDVVHVAGRFCIDQADDGVTVDAALRPQGIVVTSRGDGTCDADPHQAGFFPGFADDGGAQFFAAFLVPDGATAPATATAQLPSGFDAATATLTRKPSLDETLEHTRPAPAGRRWVGYISPVLGAARDMTSPQQLAQGLKVVATSDAPAPGTGTPGDWTAEADFRFTRGDGGLPAPATFGHAVMGGVRMAYPEAIYDGIDPTTLNATVGETFGLQLLDSRPVDCQELRGFPFPSAFGIDLGGLETDPHGFALVPTTLCGRSSAQDTLALKDLRGSGQSIVARPGERVVVPFTLRYAGDAGPTFALSATTALPGAAVTASPSALTPAGPGFTDAGVALTVPAGTVPGDYAVTLTATAGGQVRTAHATVTVPAPAAQTGGDGTQGAAGTVTAAGTVAGRAPYLEFRGFDRSGLGPDGQSINLGDALCHKPAGSCGFVTVQLTVRWEQLHAGAEAAARRRVRMVTVGTAHLAVPAQARRRVKVTVSPGVRRMLDSGEILHAVVAVRPAHNRTPIVHRIVLRRG